MSKRKAATDDANTFEERATKKLKESKLETIFQQNPLTHPLSGGLPSLFRPLAAPPAKASHVSPISSDLKLENTRSDMSLFRKGLLCKEVTLKAFLNKVRCCFAVLVFVLNSVVRYCLELVPAACTPG
jgi:hypothetical protein